ncbi:ARFRP1, partial [Symbiodinium sp. KB8]
TLLEQMKGMYIDDRRRADLDRIPPTIGMNVGKMDILSTTVTFQDLGGHMRNIWGQYYQEASGVIVVVDAADGRRLPEAVAAVQGILSSPHLAGVPVLILANKNDKVGALGARELAGLLSLHSPSGGGGVSAAATAAAGTSKPDAGTLLDASSADRQLVVASTSTLAGEGIAAALATFIPHVRSLAASGKREVTH